MNVEAINKLVKVLVKKSRKLNEERVLREGFSLLASKSKSFEFLVREPDIYSLKDIK